MKNILVTGRAGFIGCNLIKKLKSKGFNILSIDDYSSGFKENEIEGVEYINLDIEKINQIDFKAIYVFIWLQNQESSRPLIIQ